MPVELHPKRQEQQGHRQPAQQAQQDGDETVPLINGGLAAKAMKGRQSIAQFHSRPNTTVSLKDPLRAESSFHTAKFGQATQGPSDNLSLMSTCILSRKSSIILLSTVFPCMPTCACLAAPISSLIGASVSGRSFACWSALRYTTCHSLGRGIDCCTTSPALLDGVMLTVDRTDADALACRGTMLCQRRPQPSCAGRRPRIWHHGRLQRQAKTLSRPCPSPGQLQESSWPQQVLHSVVHGLEATFCDIACCRFTQASTPCSAFYKISSADGDS